MHTGTIKKREISASRATLDIFKVLFYFFSPDCNGLVLPINNKLKNYEILVLGYFNQIESTRYLGKNVLDNGKKCKHENPIY
jgi:hypothetical protein